MSVKEFEAYEKRRMEKNAWSVAQNIAARIADTPVLGNYITALISDRPDDAFFIFEDLLQKFHRSTTGIAKEAVPGAAYLKKVTFMKCIIAVVSFLWNLLTTVVLIPQANCASTVK